MAFDITYMMLFFSHLDFFETLMEIVHPGVAYSLPRV